jgi:GDPmannose 4,6-dehydratase
MSKKPVAMIFGISGQDGAYLAHLLLSKGYDVHGVSRDADGTSFRRLSRLGIRDKVKLHSGDLGEFRSVISLMTSIEPTEVYNLAGQSSVALSFELPVETFESVSVGTINVLECLRLLKAPVRFFQAVSSECFGNTNGRANEDSPLRPRSPYAMAKAASFWANSIYREAYGLHGCSGILSNHESPLRPNRFVTRKVLTSAIAISRGSRERLVLGNLAIRRDWGWAPEYIEAIWRMMRQDVPGDFVIGTGQTSSLEEFVAAVFAALKMDWKAFVDRDDALLRASEVMQTELDPGKAARELDWRARSKMTDVAHKLVTCELNGTLGPVPWSADDVVDLGSAA